VEISLAAAGWKVRSVGNAAEAAEAIDQQLPDVVLLDASMPDIDGLQALALLRPQLGAKVPVQSLSKKVMVTIKPGTQPGAVLRLKGAGLAVGDKTGDLLVTVNVRIPTNLTDRQKELLREFDTITAAA